MDNTNKQLGFTLPELVVSISLIGIISVSLFAAMMTYFVNINRNHVLIDMTADSQNLLRSTVEELRYGSGVRQTNTIPDSNGPGGGWNTSNANFVIIIAMPAVNSDGEYIIDSTTGSPYNNEFVYFKQGLVLYKRILANPDAVGNAQTTTCPTAAVTPSCPADKRLINYLDDMVFTLYDQDDASTTDPLQARSVKIDLSMRRDTFGQPLTLTNSIRTTLRNNF